MSNEVVQVRFLQPFRGYNAGELAGFGPKTARKVCSLLRDGAPVAVRVAAATSPTAPAPVAEVEAEPAPVETIEAEPASEPVSRRAPRTSGRRRMRKG